MGKRLANARLRLAILGNYAGVHVALKAEQSPPENRRLLDVLVLLPFLTEMARERPP